MANKICRITIFAFMYPEWNVTHKDGYTENQHSKDLENF